MSHRRQGLSDDRLSNSHAPMAKLYARKEALKFAYNLRSNLYDSKNPACVVNELAMKIATGGWSDCGIR